MTPAAPPVNARPLHCPRCRALLGEEGDDCLDVGGALINRRVPLICKRCRNVWGWRPGAARDKMLDRQSGSA